MYGNGWGMGMGMGWMWVVWLLIIIATVAVVALLVRSGGDRARTGGPVDQPPAHAPEEASASGRRSAARRILDERYARGEIDEQDYLERRRRLDEPDG
ncbi:hypothetical protein BJF81_00440 [Ornithinimicrobium sp. CNJ-824]|uniref:SHOCT domain-containing protein n=1 Tax=Ornithinimicrobium sp. CNJ-824 TaxID=1904966 RepID=UPI00095B5DCD|nr:SHOCT domain-containing protein [Ornithinimicrobium sp. CNJ-824]OLT22364.1 hypothetical protein BJF81_00440 [Ornithinimicrobium sp. CNJ-824]